MNEIRSNLKICYENESDKKKKKPCRTSGDNCIETFVTIIKIHTMYTSQYCDK